MSPAAAAAAYASCPGLPGRMGLYGGSGLSFPRFLVALSLVARHVAGAAPSAMHVSVFAYELCHPRRARHSMAVLCGVVGCGVVRLGVC
jgi:hypothetical protein